MSVCQRHFPPVQANGEYPLLNGDWNMGTACLGNHLMSTCQRYQGGTKSKTTGLSNQKRHRGSRFLRNLQAMKRISRGFDRNFIRHRSCLQINPTTKLWFPFIPKVPFPWLQYRGNLEEGRVVRSKTERKGNLKTCDYWIYHLNLSKGGKQNKSDLNKEQNYTFF